MLRWFTFFAKIKQLSKFLLRKWDYVGTLRMGVQRVNFQCQVRFLVIPQKKNWSGSLIVKALFAEDRDLDATPNCPTKNKKILNAEQVYIHPIKTCLILCQNKDLDQRIIMSYRDTDKDALIEKLKKENQELKKYLAAK